MSESALVTGASGLLGLAIVRALVAGGTRVRALVRRPTAELDIPGVESVYGDIRDAEFAAAACAAVDTVYHVAAVSGIWGPWEHYYSINTQGTHNILAGCRKHRVPRLVYTSSPSVTFDGQEQCGIDETAPYPERWLCHYPHTKALAEQAVLAANSVQLATCALRPHLIWGPGDRQLVPRLLARARSGRLRRVGIGQNLVDMIYVDNAAQAHLQAAKALFPGSPVAGRAYFISQGSPVNCWQWIDQLLALASLAPVRKSVSLRTAWRVGAALEAVYGTLRLRSEPPMTRFLAAQLGLSHYFRIDRAVADFGFGPTITTAEGMRRLGESLARGSGS